MEELWLLIEDTYIPVSLMISQETHEIDGKQFHEITFNSGFRKLVTAEGVANMRKASEQVDAVLGE